MKKVKSIFMKPTILLGIAAVLLLGSGVGSARAALTYYSDQYSASMDMSTIGVSLKENGKVVSSKTYDDQGDATTNGEGKLLQNLLKDDEKFALGKTYDEKLAVENSGNIDTFVRVVLKPSKCVPPSVVLMLLTNVCMLSLKPSLCWKATSTYISSFTPSA